MPRLFLDYFLAGVPRTYLYQLVDQSPDAGRIDQERNFGLLRNDFSEKPAFRTLAKLLALARPTTQAAPAGFRYAVDQAPDDVRQPLVLQDERHRRSRCGVT